MYNIESLNYSDVLNSKSYFDYSYGNITKGINLFSELVIRNPHDANLWVELGFAYLKNIEFSMAKKCFDTAFDIDPYNPNTNCALGLYYYESGYFRKARQFYVNTLKIDKNSEWGKLNLSLLEQTVGNNRVGLELYENREKEQCLSQHEEFQHSQIQELISLNTSLKNKVILVIGEQGFGDQLMICLYLKKLISLGFKVTYLVNEKLFTFLKNISDLKGIKIKKELSDKDLRESDFKVFSMSIPYLFYKSKLNFTGLNIKKSQLTKSLKNYPSEIKKLFTNRKIKVGLAWSGRPSQIRNSFRSIRLEFLDKIFKLTNYEFFILQKISNNKEKKIISKYKNLHNISKHLDNFADTAFFTSKMDLVISTCTSLVHLSGLLNKKTFLLLSKIHDPRWNYDKEKVLYDSVKIFKQRKLNDWFEPLNKIYKILYHNLNKIRR